MNIERLIHLIQNYHPETIAATSHESAVLVLIAHDETGIYLVITKRAENIAYAGDYCFPGGAKENHDPDFLVVAEREVTEELGIKETDYQLIGQLDDFLDRDGGRVRPFVAVIAKKIFDAHLHVQHTEVANVHFFPLQDLTLFQPNEELERVTRRHPSYFYMNNHVTVWGLTAGMMVQLGNILFGLDKPIGKWKS